MPSLERLLPELKDVVLTAAVSSHYHADHSDGIPYLRERYGTKSWLHPWVAGPLQDVWATHAPWQPTESFVPDALWPETGTWHWNEYEFRVAPWPGQTWWHCLFMTEVNGQHKYINVKREDIEYKIFVDDIVLATGYKKSGGFVQELQKLRGTDERPEICEIGDCVEVRDIYWAVREGYELGTKL